MKTSIDNLFNNYLQLFLKEVMCFEKLQNQFKMNEDIISRKNFEGHVTSSGIILSKDNKVLLIFHNKLQKYLQPGGHIESIDKNILETAKREIYEETNLKNIHLHKWSKKYNIPINIDTHYIPENKKKNEKEHYHHDFMFLFITDDINIKLDPDEVSGFQWIDLDIIAQENSHLGRAAQKIISLNI
jgi:8-oxo-dGTP pyrophosphatase MutT (NUDIX family)